MLPRRKSHYSKYFYKSVARQTPCPKHCTVWSDTRAEGKMTWWCKPLDSKKIFFERKKKNMRLPVAIFSIRYNYLAFPPPLRLKSVVRRLSSVRFMQWCDCFKISSCSNKRNSPSVTCLSRLFPFIKLQRAGQSGDESGAFTYRYWPIFRFLIVMGRRAKHGLVQEIQLIQAVVKFQVHLLFWPCTFLSTTETLSISTSENCFLKRNSKKCCKIGPYVSCHSDNIMDIRVIFFSIQTTIKKKK